MLKGFVNFKQMSLISILRKIIKIVMVLVITILVLLIGFFLFLTITEFTSDTLESVIIQNNQNILPEIGKPISVLSMNIGYGSLDAKQDFFMDGGSGVRPRSEQIVKTNMREIKTFFQNMDTDVYFLQEVDIDSRRSYYMNQEKYLAEGFSRSSAFAYNFKVSFVPIPLTGPIGKVASGLLTQNRFKIKNAERFSLPVPFNWPERTANLKRCLLIERVPIKNSTKELVLINLHLEAYDKGEGKSTQMKVLLDLLNMEYEKGNYIIAGGDFNQTFPGTDLVRFPIINTDFFVPGTLSQDMLDPEWSFVFDKKIPSCRLLDKPYFEDVRDTQYYFIDGFIISPNVKLISVKTIDMKFKYSDHNPVYMQVLLN